MPRCARPTTSTRSASSPHARPTGRWSQSIVDRATAVLRRYVPEATFESRSRMPSPTAAIGALRSTRDPDLRLVWARAAAAVASSAEDVQRAARTSSMAAGRSMASTQTSSCAGRWPSRRSRTTSMVPLERLEAERDRDRSDRGQRALIRAEVSRPDADVKPEAWERINGAGYGSDYLTRAAIAGFQWRASARPPGAVPGALLRARRGVYADRDHAYAADLSASAGPGPLGGAVRARAHP